MIHLQLLKQLLSHLMMNLMRLVRNSFEQTNVADQQTTSDIDSDDSKDGEVASEEDNQEISTEQDTSKMKVKIPLPSRK